jgi:trimethylamine--corrinoid protein Co-methyltransferase
MFNFQLLNPEEVEAIHQATLRVLAETGFILREGTARELLTGAGAKINGDRVQLPPELVEKCIAVAGKKVVLRGRGGTARSLGDGNLYFHNLGGARDVLDPIQRTRRSASIADVRDSTRLLDALGNCHSITPFFTPRDIPGSIMSLAMYRHALGFTLKPVQGPGVQYPEEVRYAVKMAQVIGDPQDGFTLSLSPVSPLTLPDYEARAIIEIARLGISFGPLPCPTAGTTAPFSLAGAIAQQNAEILLAVVLAQLVRPGLPIIYCGRVASMEPRTGASVWGGVELGLASAGTVQIGHRYGFAVNVYGFSTNSHTIDAQNGFERALNAVIPALAGADELSGIGEMEAGVSSSYAQMVLDDEFAGGILRARRGLTVNEDALAVDVIAAAMDGPRNYLGQKHTTRYLKAGELSLTKLAERNSWETWEMGGRKSILERAQAEAERILMDHQVPPLDDAQERELDALLASAERDLAN